MVVLRRRGVRVLVAGGGAGLALDVEERRRRQEARAAQRQPVLAVAAVGAVAAVAVRAAVRVLSAVAVRAVRVCVAAVAVRGGFRCGQRLPLLRVRQRRAQRQRPLRQVRLALWNKNINKNLLILETWNFESVLFLYDVGV